MRRAILKLGRASGVLAVSLIAGAALAQGPLPAPTQKYPIKSQETLPPGAARLPAGVGQIEIYEGPRRTVQYVAPNLSPGERASLRDLARAENEAAFVDDLQALKRRYVDSELALEPYRRSIQQQLYGYSTSSTYSGYVASGYGRGFGDYAYGVPYGGGYGYGYGGGYFGGASTTTSRSLANGVGYEGPLKDAMARQIASQSTPDYVAGSARELDVAMERVASSERLAKSFGITRDKVAPAAAVGTPIILTLKSGEKLEGSIYGEDVDWFRVDTPTGTVSVRKIDVARVLVPKK